MKKVTIAALLFISFYSYGQKDWRILSKKNWSVGESKTIYGNIITRLQGKNQIGHITNVAYQTYEQLKSEVENDAKSEMWTPEKTKNILDELENRAIGGYVSIYVSRYSIDAANADKFTIVIKDSTDTKEITRIQLESDVPEVPSGNSGWWNFSGAYIPEPLKGKIFIYLVDSWGDDGNKIFKFQVNI